MINYSISIGAIREWKGANDKYAFMAGGPFKPDFGLSGAVRWLGAGPSFRIKISDQVAPPFPRSWREGGLWPRARYPSVLASGPSIAIRSRQFLPSPSHSEQNYSTSSPLASRPILALPDCDGCSAASRCVSLPSIRENRNSEPAKSAGDILRAAFVT